LKNNPFDMVFNDLMRALVARVHFALATAPAIPAGSRGLIGQGLGRGATWAKAVWQHTSRNWPIF